MHPGEALSRRAFLGAGLALVGSAALVHVPPAFAAARRSRVVAIPFSSDLYASPEPQRFTLVLQQATSAGVRYVSGPPVEVRFRPPGGTFSPYQPMELDRAGLPKGRGVYRTSATFPEAGIWESQARIDGRTSRFRLQVPTSASAPVPGQAAPRAASPTPQQPLGVRPICTRDPECPLHSVSLSQVIGTGRPVAVLFATPARCTSQYCGPVLDELLALRAPYEDRVTFVHVDIYRDLRTTKVSPTVTAWGLPSEPWLFTVDGAGTVLARLDTAFGRNEMRAVLDRLVAAGDAAPTS